MSGAATPPAANPRAGILWMLVTQFLMVAIDSVGKHLATTYPVIEVVWARFLFAMIIMALLFHRRLPGIAMTGRLGLQLVRSLLVLVTSMFYFAAVTQISLASTNAILSLSPVVVTALSVPLLRESVGTRRWVGVAFGFLGAVIIIRPGTDMMHAAALLALGSLAGNSLYHVCTRILGRTDGPLTILFYTSVVGVVATSFAQPFVWVTPSASAWLWMAALGVLATAGHFTLIKAFTQAPAAAVTPFVYTNFLWAAAFGYAVFGEIPEPWTISGAAVITASGLYIFHRERLGRELRPGRGP